MKRILIFIFLLSLLVLLWPNEPSHNQLNKPNVISQQQVSNDRPEKPANAESPDKSKKPQSEQNVSDIKVNSLTADQSFSYLQLYRDFRYLSTCSLKISNFQSAQNIAKAKQARLAQFVESGRQQNIEVSATHLNHYEAHLDRCIVLLEKYHGTDLSGELLTAPTATKKEQQLKALRNLIQPWDDAWRHLFNVAKGHDNPEAQSLLKQIAELDEQFNQQYGHIEVQFIQQESRAHYQSKQPLYSQLEQAVKKDIKSKAQALREVQQLIDEIKSYMLLQDSDLFYEASSLLTGDRQMRRLNASMAKHYFMKENLDTLDIPYRTIAEEVAELIGPISRLNYSAIAPYANQLYLCASGADCAPGSVLMNHYCLSPEYPTACEKDLMAFFVDDYLSPNQLEDVLNLFDQLVVIYAP